MKVSTATKSRIISKTGFKNYDVCANPYVGCQFGCTYCYVRFFVTDEEKEWGEFVRVREHLEKALPRELSAGFFRLPAGRVRVLNDDGTPVLKADGAPRTRQTFRNLPVSDARLVIGTMTDPYQPQERKSRITRKMLEILISSPVKLAKVGIFTRSPIILEDIELIKQLPRARVHYTISPYEEKDTKKIEPVSVANKRRFETIEALKKAGIRVHVNVAPCIPVLSESTVDDIAQALAEARVDEFFVDPMQAYGASFEATKVALSSDERWPEIEGIMLDKDRYQAWKKDFHSSWEAAWRKHGSGLSDTMPILSDHENDVWIDMRTGKQMDHKHYGDDA